MWSCLLFEELSLCWGKTTDSTTTLTSSESTSQSLAQATTTSTPAAASTTSTPAATTTTSQAAATSSASSSDSDLSDFASSVLAEHNKKRALHKDTPALSWSDTLASYAQDYADNYDCSGTLTHSGGPYGENLALGYDGPAAVDAWYNEISNYDFSEFQAFQVTLATLLKSFGSPPPKLVVASKPVAVHGVTMSSVVTTPQETTKANTPIM